MRISALIVSLMLLGNAYSADQVPLRVDAPDGGEAIPVTGGVPFPKGALDSVDHVRLLGADKKEIPCQVAKHAVWPDGSVKWALIDAVLAPGQGQNLTLEFGAGVARAAVSDPVTAVLNGADARISGGGVKASIAKNGQGVVDELSLGGKAIVAAGKPARLRVNAIRLADDASGRAIPYNRFVCSDPSAKHEVGSVQIESISVEAPGPIRATVLVRGFVLLPSYGATLPKEVRDREPAGRMPFSMRLSFYRGTSIVTGQHQIVFTGEPDCDFIERWGIEWPGQAGTSGTLVLEPGVELHGVSGAMSVAPAASRLCWAPLHSGFALIRQGWENRPCAITQEDGAAWIDFWPRAAGVWDLRRYAREWAVGESGDPRNTDDLLRYAKYAARGMAKSHDFALHLASAAQPGAAPAAVRELSERALLVAPPGWYAKTEALGPMAPAQTGGEFAALDSEINRRLDYYLYCQDLYRWHGKLTYGFFQSRFGEIHRNDRWDNDYGRWGWALNDGAGRFGHVLMLQYLRTLDRRYLNAGEAFGRINYDTNMVHTVQHLENCKGWWTATGTSHRHNVQPFGCPYVGMRGSYPVGQRIQHLLTGDGVIADGLDLVADASYRYATGEGSRLCNSGGTDGQGSASNALLWKYETTGDKKFLDACRTIIDKSGLIPPKEGKGLGYGPSFGLFNAAGEYADLSGDKAFQDRVVELARMGAQDKNATTFAYAIAMGVRFSKDDALKAKLSDMLRKEAASQGRGLAELATKDWPGHGGFRTPECPVNLYRDVPTGLGVLVGSGNLEWPKPAAAQDQTATPPADWYKPGGMQASTERVPAAKDLMALKPGEKPGECKAGGATWTVQKALADDVEINGAHPLAASIEGYVMLDTGKLETLRAEITGIGSGANGAVIATAKAGPATLVFKLAPAQADGISSVRVEAACQVPNGSGRVASWGLKIPCKLSGKGTEIMSTAPGCFRLERCRLDQNDEKVPSWLSAMEGREKTPHWPLWREAGIQAGPGLHYRIWHANRADTSPLYVDQGEGLCAWFDLTDRGAATHWGLSARVLRTEAAPTDLSRLAVRANMESGMMLVQFHDEAAEPLSEAAGAAGLAGACDLVFHDGWRPPFSKPELTQAQYDRFIDDANIGETYGLNALRYTLSDTHKVKGREWMVKIRDLGVEPRELLYGMQSGDVLNTLCQKAGVLADANDLEGTVKRLVEHYKK